MKKISSNSRKGRFRGLNKPQPTDAPSLPYVNVPILPKYLRKFEKGEFREGHKS